MKVPVSEEEYLELRQITVALRRRLREAEVRLSRVRRALVVQVGEREQCRGCYAYLDGRDTHTPDCWAAAALSSIPSMMTEEEALRTTIAMGVPFIEAGAEAIRLLERVRDAGGDWVWLIKDRGLGKEIVEFLNRPEVRVLMGTPPTHLKP